MLLKLPESLNCRPARCISLNIWFQKLGLSPSLFLDVYVWFMPKHWQVLKFYFIILIVDTDAWNTTPKSSTNTTFPNCSNWYVYGSNHSIVKNIQQQPQSILVLNFTLESCAIDQTISETVSSEVRKYIQTTWRCSIRCYWYLVAMIALTTAEVLLKNMKCYWMVQIIK